MRIFSREVKVVPEETILDRIREERDYVEPSPYELEEQIVMLQEDSLVHKNRIDYLEKKLRTSGWVNLFLFLAICGISIIGLWDDITG